MVLRYILQGKITSTSLVEMKTIIEDFQTNYTTEIQSARGKSTDFSTRFSMEFSDLNGLISGIQSLQATYTARLAEFDYQVQDS